MEFILIHRPRGLLPLEVEKLSVEIGKKFIVKPEEFVPGGKLIAAFLGRLEELTVTIWDVPSAENLMPFFEQVKNMGWDTTVIPVDNFSDGIAKAEKALTEAAKK